MKVRGARARRGRIGVALSGGGARGFAHIGTLRVLERHGIRIDALAGTSMGAIVGALYASGMRADDLHAFAHTISWRDVIDLSLSAGLIKGEKLHALLSERLPHRFEDLKIPLAVGCTDIEAGELLLFTEGELILPIRASACFPGAFEPIEIDGRTLADGGIVNNLPVDALALMRADLTIASDVTPPRRSLIHADDGGDASWWQRMIATVTLERRAPIAAMTFRAADVMMRLLTDLAYIHHPADLRIAHVLPGYRLESFWALDAIVAAGEMQAEADLRAHPALLRSLLEASDAGVSAGAIEASGGGATAPTPAPAEPKARRRGRRG